MNVEEQATGCIGAGDYRQAAEDMGYPHLKVWDWTSSAGDWSFLVSHDGEDWCFMFQENNWPSSGFTYTVDTLGPHFYATDEDDLFEIVANLCELGY